MNEDRIVSIKKESCTGCAGCAAICPVNAIGLVLDESGFINPEIDLKKCVDCGLCERLCEESVEYRKPKKVFIAKHKDRNIHRNSQSGGAFTSISDYILSQGGVIYGAAFNDNYDVVHIRAMTPEMRNRMRGSKYVQSNIQDVYQKIEEDLKNEQLVLFVGSGCQVSGVLKFLKKRKIDQTKLFTIDILCHGVPSIFLWRDTLQYFRMKYGADITSIGLKEIQECTRPEIAIRFGKMETTDILYRKLYYSNLALRESCYSCKYNLTERVGDFTIGDAWGIDRVNPEFNDKRGVSLILVNSEKALKIEKNVLCDMVTKEVDLKDYVQECMVSSASPKRDPAQFWKDYHNRTFEYVMEKYGKHNILLNIPYILKRVSKKIKRD